MSANPVFNEPAVVSLAPAIPADLQSIDYPDPEIGRLRSQLTTERSAGKALIGAITELEGRLATERSNVEQLGAQLIEAEAVASKARAEADTRRDDNTALWGEINLLNGALSDAYARPLWKRLLGRY